MYFIQEQLAERTGFDTPVKFYVRFLFFLGKKFNNLEYLGNKTSEPNAIFYFKNSVFVVRECVCPVRLVTLSVGRAHLLSFCQMKLLFSPVFIYFCPFTHFWEGKEVFFKTNSRNTEKFSIDFIHFDRFNSGVETNTQVQFQRVFRTTVSINLCFIGHLSAFCKGVF